MEMISLISRHVVYLRTTRKLWVRSLLGFAMVEMMVKCGTQFGTQKGAERTVQAVDAEHAVRVLLSEFSAC